MKNLTLSADEDLIAKARTYAQARGTTLNQMVREYLARLAGGLDPCEAAEEFAALARAAAGRSPEGWRFERDEIHRRGAES